MASAMPDLRLSSQPKLALIAPTHKGMADLTWVAGYILSPSFWVSRTTGLEGVSESEWVVYDDTDFFSN